MTTTSSLGTSLFNSTATSAGTVKATGYKPYQTADSTASTGDSSSGGATISLQARIAAAEAADNAKDFSKLESDVRSDLDAQYAAAKTKGTSATPDLSEMSGRALAAIVLNKSGSFSRAEVQAAHQEMNGRARTAMVGGGLNASGIAAYSQQLLADYKDMSDEERQARGLTPDVIKNATAMAQQTSGPPSLFDLI